MIYVFEYIIYNPKFKRYKRINTSSSFPCALVPFLRDNHCVYFHVYFPVVFHDFLSLYIYTYIYGQL